MLRYSWLICTFLFVQLSVFAQVELGHPYTEVYSSKRYNGPSTAWEMTQTPDGLIYFGNSAGAMSFDGRSWRTYSVTTKTTVRSLDAADDGTIYLGAKNDFGYLSPDSSGQLVYTALSDHIPEEERTFKDVWNTYVTRHGVFYLTFRGIFRWHDNELTKFDSIPLSPHLGFYVNDEMYILHKTEGLKVFDGNDFVDVPGGNILGREKVYSLLSYSADELLVATRHSIIVLNTKTGAFRDFKCDVTDELMFFRIYHGAKLHSGNFAFATLGGGIYIIAPSGKIIRHITTDHGLSDNNVKYLFVDASHDLWACTANGLTRIEIELPLSYFGEQQGITGIVRDVIRWNSTLYVATGNGLFKMGLSEDSTQAEFTRPFGFNDQSWQFYRFGSHLLLATSSGLYEVREDAIELLKEYNAVFAIHGSSNNDSLAYLSLKDGIATIELETNADGSTYVKCNRRTAGLDEEIHKVLEDKMGNLWCSTPFSYLIYIPKPARFDTFDIEPRRLAEGVIQVSSEGFFTYDGDIYAFSEAGNYKVTSESEVLKQIQPVDFQFNGLDSNARVMAIHEGPDDLVYVHYHGTYRRVGMIKAMKKEDGTFDIDHSVFPRIREKLHHTSRIFCEGDSLVWFGASEGLVCYNATHEFNSTSPFNINIRNVLSTSDSVLYNGEIPITMLPEFSFDYHNNGIKFEYVAASYQNAGAIHYRYTLEPFESAWSEWGLDPRKEYTNLPENDYTFRVQARDVYGRESTVARFEFMVLPPWYRTVWAYICYAIGLLIVLYVYNKISTYRLHKSKRKLELIVQERTREITKEKKIVEEKNEEITTQSAFIAEVNATLQQRDQDITDSINYAKQIQKSILSPTDRLFSKYPESFILYMPRDIVSGDFYWFDTVNNVFILACADCTGHGVPGAFMSMVCSTLLDKVVRTSSINSPEEALKIVDQEVIKALSQQDTEKNITINDGMDVGLVVIHPEKMWGQFAGAFRPLLLYRDGEPIVFKGGRYSIGGSSADEKDYTGHSFDLKKGDMLYLFSDGYADQFGGSRNKKFKARRLNELLDAIHELPGAEQKKRLKDAFMEWRGDERQTDDVLVIGIRI